MGTISPVQKLALQRDASGVPVETLAIERWHVQRMAVTNAAWVKLPATPMDNRTSVLVQSLETNTAKIILVPEATGYSNDLANAACGIVLGIGRSIEPNFGSGLDIYARVEVGGAACVVIVGEAK